MKSKAVFTPKQRELLKLWKQNKLCRINILEGSIRSGKTWISLVLWALYIATSPKDKNYLMTAKTLTSLKRNCLELLEELVGTTNFTYSVPAKEARLFGRKIYLEGVNDARSESKIRGMTLQAAYCDELTLFTEQFFSMLLSRLSESNAMLIGTTNPDTPKHWLKLNYLDKKDKLDLMSMKFLIDDNTFLDKAFIESQKKEHTGVFYERFILGNWVVAEGAIYKKFSENKNKYRIKKNDVPKLEYINIGEDFGGNGSQHAYCACGFPADFSCLYVLKSKSLNAKGTDVFDINDALDNFASEIENEYGFVDCVYADSAEQAIINTQRKLKWNILNSIKNEIIDRIRCTDYLFATGRIKIVEGENDDLEDGLECAVWDSKSINKDKRLDDGTSNIDILDAFEYAFEPFIKILLQED